METKTIETTAAIVMRGGRRFARWYATAMLAFGGLWAAGAFVNSLQYPDHSSVLMHLIIAVIVAGMACVAAALPMAVVLFVLFAAFAR